MRFSIFCLNTVDERVEILPDGDDVWAHHRVRARLTDCGRALSVITSEGVPTRIGYANLPLEK